MDKDGNAPVTSAPYYKDAWTRTACRYGYWDLADGPGRCRRRYLALHKNVVWFTGNSYPAPITPVRVGARGAARRRRPAVHVGPGHPRPGGRDDGVRENYLHIDWDGTEVQNDKATEAVHAVAGNPVTDGIGVGADRPQRARTRRSRTRSPRSRRRTAAFTDDTGETDALSVADGAYKVVFLAFPMEAYGTSAQKADLVHRVLTYFGS